MCSDDLQYVHLSFELINGRSKVENGRSKLIVLGQVSYHFLELISSTVCACVCACMHACMCVSLRECVCDLLCM